MRKFAKVCICGMAAAVLLTGCSKKNSVEPTSAAETEATSFSSNLMEPIEGVTLGADEDKVVLGEYKGLEVEAVPVEEVKDEEVEQRVQYVLASNPITEVPADHVAQNGDTVNIDFVGKKDGVAFEGGTAEGQDLQLGSGSFIPGFEEGLVGVKAGDKKDLNLTFPENYPQADLAGAAVVFEVTVNSFTSIVPELNDEFVAAHSETSKNVDAFREELREQIGKEKEAAALLMKKNALFTEVINNSEVSVTDKTLEEEYNRQLLISTNRAQALGMDLETMLSLYGMDMSTFQNQLRQAAAQMARENLIIDAIADQEGIVLNDTEREEIAKDIGYGSVDAMESAFGEVTTNSFLMAEKVVAFLADNAVEK
ncbi:trigger factor [Clostridium sp. chh4-2]|uniref:trigger factor n=1 Tax=Clostridium sp. chh4-2 TaxID=2067550 RepID=UPI000CCF984C|nr:trigger factor [Clostridium sp. chh4-2]PNV61925.1 trigger factor [Clostridium sp. chh4-2]